MSYNGVQFVSKELKNLFKKYGVQHLVTSTHSPEANASERVNRSIVAAIQAYVDSDQSTWDHNLSSITSALRNAAHASTGHSPYFLRNLQLLPVGDVQIVLPAEFCDVVHGEVKDKLHQAHQRNSRTYNTRSREVTFKPGQEVYIRNFSQRDFSKNFKAKLGKK